jgi:uncharacterized lipoprotein
LGLALLMLPLGGCHWLTHANSCHNHQSYMDAKSVAPLKIPSGLDAPETANALRIPSLNEPPPPQRSGRDPCLDAPPAFKVQKPPQA